MRAFHLVSFRSGVMSSVTARNRSVQTPVSWVISAIGLPPSASMTAPYVSHATGPRHATNTRLLTSLRNRNPQSSIRNPQSAIRNSVVFLQIHPGVERRDLIVAVEHQRLALEELANPPLARLRPTRMVHFGIHVRVETVLLRRRHTPRGFRLLLDEPDTDDRLDALGAVFHKDPAAH